MFGPSEVEQLDSETSPMEKELEKERSFVCRRIVRWLLEFMTPGLWPAGGEERVEWLEKPDVSYAGGGWWFGVVVGEWKFG